MRKGDFEEAWKFSDNVLEAGINRDHERIPRHFQCIWDGRPLNGKHVLIRCYHGLGDTIQFIRYVPLVKKIASKVTVWVQPKLLRLLESMEGIDQLIPLHDGVPEAEYDVDAEIMELPHIFRTTLDTIPVNVPYLHAEPVQLSVKKNELAVGLVWRAGDWNQSRNIPYSLLMPFTGIKGIQLYILQPDAPLAGWQEGFGIHRCEHDLLDYAQIVAGLDLLITIDSMPAHLAGALNVPVWLLLPAEADWRWLENRSDSPWYPSMTLFRQPSPGNWEAVISQVLTELRVLVTTGADVFYLRNRIA